MSTISLSYCPVTVDDVDQGLFGQIHLTLIVQSNVDQHRQAFQLKSTSTKHFKVNFSEKTFVFLSNFLFRSN